MIHFPGRTNELIQKPKKLKKVFLANVDLEKENFIIKVADLGFSKKLKEKK